MSPKRITIDDLAMMVQKGFSDIYEKMATKEDLKAFATKEDLRAFATKQDLLDLEERLVFRFERRFELIDDKLRIIETALQREGIISSGS